MKELEKQLSEVGRLIVEGIDKWIEAGGILCTYLDSGGSIEKAADLTGLTADVLTRFEQIGRKQIHPRLLASNSPGMRLLSTCSYSAQERYTNESVEVMTATGDTLLVAVDNMTPDQCRQVFTRGHIRPLAEQRAFIESEKLKVKQLPAENLPYSIVGRKITFRKNTTLTAAEMKKLLRSM